jgi:proteasome lid subunit RPN8/RPN11
MAGAIARLVLSERHLADVRGVSESAYPLEACALLIGRSDGDVATLTRLILAANIDPDPRRGFELDPKILIATLRGLREAGGTEHVIGHVHSHPDAAAEPSARDLALAHEPGLIWIIVPVAKGKAGQPKAWRAESGAEGNPAFVEISIAPLRE